jgi:endo-1,4-beta-xylanase
MGAPAGLTRKDMTPKPIYERLHALIKGRWWTKTEAATDAAGVCRVRGFMGDYKATVDRMGKEFEMKKAGNEWRIVL